MTKAKKPAARVAAAAGTASTTTSALWTAQDIERAMSEAAARAQAAGVTDPAEVRAAMIEEKDAFKAWRRDRAAKASKKIGVN